MENDEILKALSEGVRNQAEETADSIQKEKFILAGLGEERYAFPSRHIREIMLLSELYFIPFVPPYIRGLINRHGDPFAVIDLHVLCHNEKLDGSKVLIMNIEESQSAFLISDVLKIMDVPMSSIHSLSAAFSEVPYFNGSFEDGGQEILIVNIDEVFKRLENDLLHA